MKKFKERVKIWAHTGLGLHYAICVYRTYILPTLGFIAQLRNLPEAWGATEHEAMKTLIPGPAKWIRPKDLHALGDWGFAPVGIPSLNEIARASQFRLACREAAASGGLKVHKCAETIRDSRTQFILRELEWTKWLDEIAVQVPSDNSTALRKQGITVQGINKELQGDMPHPTNKA